MPAIWLVLIAVNLLSLLLLGGYEIFTLMRTDDPHEPLTYWVRDVVFEWALWGHIAVGLFCVYWGALLAFVLWLGPHWLVDRRRNQVIQELTVNERLASATERGLSADARGRSADARGISADERAVAADERIAEVEAAHRHADAIGSDHERGT